MNYWSDLKKYFYVYSSFIEENYKAIISRVEGSASIPRGPSRAKASIVEDPNNTITNIYIGDDYSWL